MFGLPNAQSISRFEFGILVPPPADYLFDIWDLLFVILINHGLITPTIDALPPRKI
jgi:hypothetical protein